jgi:hypothetical protein
MAVNGPCLRLLQIEIPDARTGFGRMTFSRVRYPSRGPALICRRSNVIGIGGHQMARALPREGSPIDVSPVRLRQRGVGSYRLGAGDGLIAGAPA